MYWLDNGKGYWGDADGHAVDPPSAADGRAVTEITDDGRRVAAIVHDAALEDDQAFIDSATSYAVMTLENHRLSAQTSSLLRAVRESRVRIQVAADEERRRIERDLHDGAQQRLVALRIKLELAAEKTDNGHGNGAEGAATLRRLGKDVEDALEEVRSLARGIYPTSLDRGLVDGCGPPPSGTPSRPPSWLSASAATRATWRARRTSAASRRSRTRRSTPRARASR